MAIYVYKSTDTSAPQLNGTAGALISVLDACLVNGYGDKTSMGWTKAYSGTNLATYRMPVGTSRMYMAVDDTNTTIARQRGFHDISTAGITGTLGSQPFPSDIQYSGGLYYSKSATANSTPRAWFLFSNGKIFYFAADVYSDNFATSRWACFGDISSYNAYDINQCIIIGNDSNFYNPFGVICPGHTVLGSHFLARRYDGIQPSVGCGKTCLSGYFGVQVGSRVMGGSTIQSIQYPNVITGEIFLSPIIINEVPATNIIVPRGRLPGIYNPCHALPFSTGDTFDGATGTPLEGKSFFAVRQQQYNSVNLYGVCLIEVSDTQDTPHFR